MFFANIYKIYFLVPRFGETPFKRSFESPSAWKSPWLSFMPGPRVDTEITIDVGLIVVILFINKASFIYYVVFNICACTGYWLLCEPKGKKL